MLEEKISKSRLTSSCLKLLVIAPILIALSGCGEEYQQSPVLETIVLNSQSTGIINTIDSPIRSPVYTAFAKVNQEKVEIYYYHTLERKKHQIPKMNEHNIACLEVKVGKGGVVPANPEMSNEDLEKAVMAGDERFAILYSYRVDGEQPIYKITSAEVDFETMSLAGTDLFCAAEGEILNPDLMETRIFAYAGNPSNTFNEMNSVILYGGAADFEYLIDINTFHSILSLSIDIGANEDPEQPPAQTSEGKRKKRRSRRAD